MNTRIWKKLRSPITALIAAVVAYLILPSNIDGSVRAMWISVIVVAVVLLELGISRVPRLFAWLAKHQARSILRGLLELGEQVKNDPEETHLSKWVTDKHFYPWLAKQQAQFIFRGLMEWGEDRRNQVGKADVWNWVIDQLLVAQGRYAFSISCIAFELRNGTKSCLLVRRRFEGLTNEVFLWPGGRFRGIRENLLDDLKEKIRADTGCTVTILPAPQSITKGVEDIDTYTPATEPRTKNQLLPSPILIMKQNRTQTHQVPGHIDLIYLGEVIDTAAKNDHAVFMTMKQVNDHPQTDMIWHDTRRCIECAGELYDRVKSARGTTGSP